MPLYQRKKKKPRISPFRPSSVAMVLEGDMRDELDVFVRLNHLFKDKARREKEGILRNRFQITPVTESALDVSASTAKG